jgi:hypothetical protein
MFAICPDVAKLLAVTVLGKGMLGFVSLDVYGDVTE